MPCSFWKCQCGRPYLPQRYLMVIFMCLAVIVTMVQRAIFGLVITHMTYPINNTTSPCEDEYIKTQTGIGEWDLFAIGIVLASFFVGFTILLLPAGYVADKLGGRFVCITAVAVSSVVTIIFPILVKNTFFWMVCVGRGFVGGSSACIFVSAATLISRWIPRTEWCTVCGAVFASSYTGIVYGNVLGIVASDTIGWESVFYIWGGIGLAWTIFALLFLYSDPEVHPSMTNRERVYLEAEAKPISPQHELDWVAILLDPAVWALAAAHVGHAYLAYALATNLPEYYVTALDVDLEKRIIVIVLPYLAVWVVAILLGILADHFIHYKGWRPSIIWKIYFTLASVIPAVFVLVMPMMECNVMTAIILASFGLVMTAPFFCSITVNALNLTYNYPGFVTGASHMCGGVVHFLMPFLVLFITRDNTFAQWRIVSYVIFASAILNNILYAILGSSKRRLWDMTPEERAYYREQKRLEDEAKKAANTPEAREAAAKKAEQDRKARDDKKKAEAEQKRAEKEAAHDAKKKARDDKKRNRDNLRRAEHDMTN